MPLNGLHFFCKKPIYFNMISDCPGTKSEAAGKVDACSGCPNQTICASSLPKGPDKGS